MPSQFEKYRVKDGDETDSGFYNTRFRDLDRRLTSLEDLEIDWEAATKTVADVGLLRINELLLPAIQEIEEVANLGALFTAVSTSSVEIVESGNVTVTIAENQRDRFAPGEWLAATHDTDNYMVGQKVSYDSETGALVLDVIQHQGSGTYEAWTVSHTAIPVGVSIPNLSVTTEKLAGAAVATEKVADGAVTTAKIADSAVATAKIADGAVAEAKLASGSVTEGKIADGAVTEGKIADGAVAEAKLASGSVTEGKIASGSVTEGKIASGSVTEGKIANGAVTEGKIADGAVTEGKIADGAVTAAKLADGPGSGVDADTVDGIHAADLGGVAAPTSFTALPVGFAIAMRNDGSAVSNNATRAGSSLHVFAGGVLGAPPGTWKNISGKTIAQFDYGLFVRTA
jgi:hypothetical protein